MRTLKKMMNMGKVWTNREAETVNKSIEEKGIKASRFLDRIERCPLALHWAQGHLKI